MKIYFVFVLVLLLSHLNAQEVLWLKPGAIEGKDCRISIGGGDPSTQNTNYGDFPSFAIRSWTFAGNPAIYRALIDFNLKEIHPSDSIVFAGLTFFHDENSPLGSTHEPNNASNHGFLRHILNPWEEMKVTWQNQPNYSFDDEVFVKGSVYPNEDFKNIDVTELVKAQVKNPDKYFGFMFMLQEEIPYQRLLFASSDHPNSELHPEILIIYYPQTSSVLASNTDEFSIYPNPTSDYIYFEPGNESTTYFILDDLGRKISQGKSNGSVDVTHLSPGNYFLVISTKMNHTSTSRFIKL